MSIAEFTQAYDAMDRRLDAADRQEAIAMACRGSGNPAVLAWLAEACRIDHDTLVLDIGGGLGGPSAWLHDRYGCRTVSIDPVRSACVAASNALGVPAAVACGTALPLPDASVDVALLLGVVSCVPDPEAVLIEARRVGRTLATITYVSTGDRAVHCGGSRFPTPDEVERWLSRTGWTVQAGPTTPALPAPPTWQECDAGDDPDEDEAQVVDAIADGAIDPLLLVAT